jgi:type II secretory pathway pseudopilin PulG
MQLGSTMGGRRGTAATRVSSAARKRSERGITLLEMLIALILAVGTCVAAFPSVQTFLAASREARTQNLALFDLEACVEDFQAIPFKNTLQVFQNPDPDLNPLTRYQELHLPDQQITATFLDAAGNPAIDPPSDPLHAIFEVSWTDVQGKVRRLTMATAKAR